MSKPRRRKQKKQVKPELKLRQFAATELSDQLAALPCAADLPRFMVDTVAGAYAPADAHLMIEGFGAAAARPVTLRANTLKATAEDIAAALDAAGIAHNPVAWYPDAFILPEAQVSDLWDLDIYRDGKIYLQSLSSMMPPLVLGAQAGEDILDMCAAPGGKTTQIAALTQGQAHLTACEMNIPRAEKLESNLHRQGAKNVPVMRIDARELDEFFRFDRILLDAPCTGTGTVISGNEKSLRGLTEQLLSKCARSQRALLDRAMGALKPGGTLVYSTCSIMPQENEDALQEALDKHMDCELIPLDGTPSESEARRAQEAGEEPRVESNALTEAIAAGQVSAIANGLPGTLTIPPSRDFEGFYIALIRKRSYRTDPKLNKLSLCAFALLVAMLFKHRTLLAFGPFALNGRDHKVDDRGGNDCAHTQANRAKHCCQFHTASPLF